MKLNLMKIKLKRIEKGFTQKDMADVLDLYYESYAKKERGLISFSFEDIFKIMEKLGVKDINDFIDYD